MLSDLSKIKLKLTTCKRTFLFILSLRVGFKRAKLDSSFLLNRFMMKSKRILTPLTLFRLGFFGLSEPSGEGAESSSR